MMVIAVGSGSQVGEALPSLGGLLRRPLLTVERVRVCKRDGGLLAAPDAVPGADEHGMALWQKLMVYTSEADRHCGQPVYRAIVRRLRSAGMSGATTLRGIWGFHGDHAPHGDRLLQLGRHVPAVTIVIDSPERISAAFSVIDELTAERGLVTSETIPAMRASGGGRRRGGTRLATHHLPKRDGQRPDLMRQTHTSRHAAEFSSPGRGPGAVQKVGDRLPDSCAVADVLRSGLFSATQPANCFGLRPWLPGEARSMTWRWLSARSWPCCARSRATHERVGNWSERRPGCSRAGR
jgi:PII-like signaling protein